ncbi:DUF928 domain-containing protein [Phormidesmis sp. 146-35]
MKAFRLLTVTALLLTSIGFVNPEISEARSRFVFRPPQRKNPPSTAGAASRSGFCLGQQEPLSVLAPRDRVNLTSREQLTLLAYIPKTSARSLRVVLDIYPSSGTSRPKRFYEAVVPVSKTPGIVRLPLSSATTPKLQPGQLYRWTVALRCSEQDRSDDTVSRGWVEYLPVNTTLAQALKQASPERRSSLLAEAGLWHDTLLSLDEARNPNNAAWKNDWKSLLTVAGLESLSNAPRIDK